MSMYSIRMGTIELVLIITHNNHHTLWIEERERAIAHDMQSLLKKALYFKKKKRYINVRLMGFVNSN